MFMQGRGGTAFCRGGHWARCMQIGAFKGVTHA